MSTVVSDITTLVAPRAGTRAVFVTAGGDVYIILLDGTTTLRCFKKSNSTFSEQDSGDAPSATSIAGIDARFDGTLIHVVYQDYDGSDYDIKYVTFNTSDDQWGTPEDITAAIDNVIAARRDVAISLDSSDKPHVVYTVAVTYHGTDYPYIKYKNKTGVDWSAEESVSVTAEEIHLRMSVGHESDDRFVVIWRILDIVLYRSRSSTGTWDTEATVKADSTFPSLTIDNDDKKQVSLRQYSSPYALYHVEGGSGADPTWTPSSSLDENCEYPTIACKTGGTNLYIVYEETSLNDILLVKKENGSWSSPETLQEGTFREGYAQNPTSANDFDYIFKNDDDSKIYWDEYSLAVVPPANTVYLVKATGKRTQISTGATAIRIDPTTGRRSLDTALTKYLVREDDGTLRAKSA